jgi:hypothetical protein
VIFLEISSTALDHISVRGGEERAAVDRLASYARNDGEDGESRPAKEGTGFG